MHVNYLWTCSHFLQWSRVHFHLQWRVSLGAVFQSDTESQLRYVKQSMTSKQNPQLYYILMHVLYRQQSSAALTWQAIPSMSTSTSPSSALNPVPVMVTSVPPRTLPSWGDTWWMSASVDSHIHNDHTQNQCHCTDLITMPNSLRY